MFAEFVNGAGEATSVLKKPLVNKKNKSRHTSYSITYCWISEVISRQKWQTIHVGNIIAIKLK